MTLRKLTVAFFRASFIICSFVFFSCKESDDDLKAIWAYEQIQTGDPDFQFYPIETNVNGKITVNDSIRIITNGLSQPLDSLIRQNSSTLQSLLQMQSLYVKYNMETLRENISGQIDELEKSQKQLNQFRAKLTDYKRMKPDDVLIRKVECRFQYTNPLSQQKITKDKIYYISTENGDVVMAEEKNNPNSSSPR